MIIIKSMKVSTRILLVLPLFFLGAQLSFALDFRLSVASGSKSITMRETLLPGASGYIADIVSSLGERDRLILDSSFSTVEWQHSDPSTGSQFRALRQGTQISLTGSLGHTAVRKTYQVGNTAWYEFQELSYPRLVKEDIQSAQFWTIDRSSLDARLFEAARSKTAVTVGALDAWEYTLTIQGVPGFLFSARLLLSQDDGRFLSLSIPPILGNPGTEIRALND